MAMSVTYTTIGGVIVHEALSGNRERELTADPLGSLVKIRTSVLGYSYSAEYWPYGEVQSQTGSNPTRWAFVGLLGYMRDLATMFYVRARYYRAALTRWMTVDPVWPSQPAFSYALASPAVHVDPTGLIPFWIIALLILLAGAACAYCALRILDELKDIDLGTQDKRKHCVMACMLHMRCGAACASLFVIGTEFFDVICKILGGDCHPTLDDIAANLAGFICGSISRVTTCIPWWIWSPRPWCEECCSSVNYGGQGPGQGPDELSYTRVRERI